MYLNNSVWSTSFTANIINKEKIVSSARSMRLPLAVCTVIPYTSSDPEKAFANTAIMIEWIRYHTKLGMKVIVYDRDGANRDYIFNSSYGISQGILKLDFVYHNYTIRGLLDPLKKGLRYDNTEKRFVYQSIHFIVCKGILM